MAPIPGFGDLVQVTLNQTLFGQQTQNGIYFIAEPEGSFSYETLGDDVIDWYKTNVLAHLGSNLTLRSVDVRDMTQNDGAVVTRTTGLPADGGNETESLPSNVAFVITFKTAQGGRRGRGRNYIMGIPESQSNGAQISGTLAAGLQAAYQLLVGPGALTNGWTWCVASRVGAGADGLPTQVYPITAAVARDLYFDSQRRRLPGRGR